MGDKWYGQAGGNRTPTTASEIGGLWREIRRLWVALKQQERPKKTHIQAWSYPGTVAPAANEDGPKMHAHANLRLGSMLITLQGASSADYTVHTMVNGTNQKAVTLSAGNLIVLEGLNISVTVGSTFWPRLLTADTATGTMMSIIIHYIEDSL